MANNPLTKSVEQLMFEDRLDAIREGAARARAAHIVMTVASLALFVALWNAYLSRYGPETQTPGDAAHQKIVEERISHWMGTQWVSVGPLGIQVGASDLGVWGGVGLAVISIWFFLAVRRENHIVGRLISDVWDRPRAVKLYIFHGIISRQLFVMMSNENTPIGKELPAPALQVGKVYDTESGQKRGRLQRLRDSLRRRIRKWRVKDSKEERIQQLSDSFVDSGISVLFYLPPLTVICIFAADSIRLLKGEWQTLNGVDKTEVVVMLAISLLSATGLTVVSHEIARFRKATRDAMREFWDHIQNPRRGKEKN